MEQHWNDIHRAIVDNALQLYRFEAIQEFEKMIAKEEDEWVRKKMLEILTTILYDWKV